MNWTARRNAIHAVALLGTVALAGCAAPKPEVAAPPPAPAASASAATGATVTDGKKDLKEAVCVVCAANGGHEGQVHPEPVAASVLYHGKGYYFCNEGEKAEFISNPTKYAVPTS